MLDARLFGLFLVASLALLITPGPAVLYVVTRAVDQGRSAGLVSALGVLVGTLCHVAAAALGLSALLMSSALAFRSVKYLIYLGIRKLRSRDGAQQMGIARQKHRLISVFRQGIIVNLFNPKTALFFLAFLPQFVDVRKGSVAIQILALGTIFACMGFATDSSWALLAGSVATKMNTKLGFDCKTTFREGFT